MKIKQLIRINDVKSPTIVFLEGVLMSNGEFCCNGKSFFLQDCDKTYCEDKSKNGR